MAHTGQDADGNSVTKEQFITHLVNRTGWNETDMTALLDEKDEEHNLLKLEFNKNFTGAQALTHLIRLSHIVDLLARLGVPALQAWGWTPLDATRDIANEVKQAARAKFDVDPWRTVAEPIRDGLRLIQRDALVDAALNITSTDGIEDTADLYAYFLIDIEMNPCMLTSRIKQAISSVQLFVQRCLLNLEHPAVVLDEKAADEWKWRKNYRVWEANRKIFLYPENWLEPELRRDKSPFFVELENELLQNDVTAETVENAFLNYLEKLDQVARLEIVSIYNDTETKTLYVLGRTKAIPHQYFLRQLHKGRRWTPWEPVPVDIEGENVAITRYNRRLYLFWFMTQEKAGQGANKTSKVPAVSEEENSDFEPSKPQKYLEIKLAWSQYRNGKWSPKQLSEAVVRTKSRIRAWRPRQFRPRPIVRSSGDLHILVDFVKANRTSIGGQVEIHFKR